MKLTYFSNGVSKWQDTIYVTDVLTVLDTDYLD